MGRAVTLPLTDFLLSLHYDHGSDERVPSSSTLGTSTLRGCCSSGERPFLSFSKVSNERRRQLFS